MAFAVKIIIRQNVKSGVIVGGLCPCFMAIRSSEGGELEAVSYCRLPDSR